MMTSLNTITKTPMLTILATFTIQYIPTLAHLFWLCLAVVLDLITGLLKAWSKGQVTTSSGFRKTIIKIGSYVGTVVGFVILVNVMSMYADNKNIDLSFLINWLMGFMIFIELYSVFENIDAAYPDSIFSKYISSPILKLLKGKLKDSPFTSLGQKDTKDDKPADQGESK